MHLRLWEFRTACTKWVIDIPFEFTFRFIFYFSNLLSRRIILLVWNILKRFVTTCHADLIGARTITTLNKMRWFKEWQNNKGDVHPKTTADVPDPLGEKKRRSQETFFPLFFTHWTAIGTTQASKKASCVSWKLAVTAC